MCFFGYPFNPNNFLTIIKIFYLVNYLWYNYNTLLRMEFIDG